MLIAIDHGNYAVKTPSFSFVSGLSEHTVKPPLTDEIIEYAETYFNKDWYSVTVNIKM